MKTQKNEGGLCFRSATTADITTLLEIEKSVAGRNTYSAMLEESEWKKELQNCVVYLIEKGDVVVGNVSYEKKDSNSVYISGLVVCPQFSGRGIAREALVKVLNELKDFERIYLVTHPDNKPALSLYQSLGFIVESRIENYYDDREPRLVLALQSI